MEVYNKMFIEESIYLYGTEIAISLVTCALLWNIFIISKINFGQASVTRITILPYYASLMYLIILLAETIV